MKSLFFALLSACYLIAPAQVLNSGLLSGTAFANITGVGTASWTNLSNLATNNNSSASVGILLAALGTANTRYISASTYNMTIPSDAVIDGIEVQVRRRAQGLGLGCSLTDNIVSIVKRNSVTGINKKLAAAWPTSYAYATYGSDTALWGTTWTPDDINDGGFGIALSTKFTAGLVGITLTAQVDHIQTIVYYHIPAAALPVKLVQFRATSMGNNTVQLDWATALELNNDYFEVQRSNDARDWQAIGMVYGMGNSTVMNSYSYIDETSVNANTYYRLKQVDYDGAFEYSPIVSINASGNSATTLSVAYTNDNILLLTSNAMNEAQVQLYDLAGSEVWQYQGTTNEHVSLNDSALPPGIYVAVASAAGNTTRQKIYKAQ